MPLAQHIAISLSCLILMCVLPVADAQSLGIQPNHPIPYEPPDASRIHIGASEGIGEAAVTGKPGAAMPEAVVLLVNLHTGHQAHAISATDGSFAARIFAPPGSALMIKHGPQGERWRDLDSGVSEGINPFPGTIINLPHTHQAGEQQTPFAAVGAVELHTDDPVETRNTVGAAWSVAGTMEPVSSKWRRVPDEAPGPQPAHAAGDLLRIEGTLRLYSQAITHRTVLSTVSVEGIPHLRMLFTRDGHPLPVQNVFTSSLLTPTGFPIQRGGLAFVPIGAPFQVRGLRWAEGHTLAGELATTVELPQDLPDGVYQPVIHFVFDGIPTSTEWLAANVTRTTVEPTHAVLPPITVGRVKTPRLIWRLLMDDFVQGTRGATAREDTGIIGLSSQIVTQGAPYFTPPVDARTGNRITYRLEPFLPMISFTDRRMPTPPLLPLHLPGGQLSVSIRQPDGTVRSLGSGPLVQSFHRTRTTRHGADLNVGTVQLEDIYSLKTESDQFRIAFSQYGHHVITMTGTVQDIWGNTYNGGGTYDVWLAHPLDIDFSILPGTPLAVGIFNPYLQVLPPVAAEVDLRFTLYPDSNPYRARGSRFTGTANRFGYFGGRNLPPPISQPGEYRVDLTAQWWSPDGALFMGAMTWGSVVMTPEHETELVAHGRRGVDSLDYIPNHWFVAGRDLGIPNGAVSHTLNPYYSGDIVWTREIDAPYGGDALIMGASVQDLVGTIEAAIQMRVRRQHHEFAGPSSYEERVAAGELPLFISSRSRHPLEWTLRQTGASIPEEVDQIAYSYRVSQRPGVRVREAICEDSQSGGYWRLGTLYDDQLGVGVLGDLVNDFKFQYVGVVYRDLDTGHTEYLGQGTGWVFIPEDDPVGSRVMPPFAGPGNGGWTTEGGPILTLKGEEIHLFILPTGTRPGSVLEMGDRFSFAGHIMPTLDSKVEVTVTSPTGRQHRVAGQATSIGYFSQPGGEFVVDEPGAWAVDVRVWHDGQCSGGQTMPPYPSGHVLGSEAGRYWFYVVPPESPRLDVSAPPPGFLSFDWRVAPVVIRGNVPGNLTDAVVDYTITMPGYILEHGQADVSNGKYKFVFDPEKLHHDFPNIDLSGRDSWEPGLADTFSISMLLSGKRDGKQVFRANCIVIQGEEVIHSIEMEK